MKKLIASIAVCILVLWAGYRLWYSLALRAVASSGTPVIVTIPKGTSTSGIAKLLEEKELVRSALAFSLFVRKNGDASKLQAGSFVLNPSMNAAQLADALTSGSSQEAPVTIPEGFTVKDIDALLAKEGLIEAGQVSACARTCDFSGFSFLPTVSGLADRGGRLEGYLYPDTYFVVIDDLDPKQFLERLLSVFEQRVVDDLASDIKASGRSLHDIVTMASLIEEETRTNDERPVVSGILWKRFDAQMGLGVDATVRYILEKQTAALTTADLNTDSPYNLRKFRGLPPGPIASPGLASIKAAMHPEESEYWYYLHGNDGVIRYAITNEEHNLNKAKYLR